MLGTLLLLTAALLRARFHFCAPQQLAAFEAYPTLMTAAYSAYSVGWLVMCFAVLVLVHQVALWNRTWAFWGGALTLIGLFTRTFSAGVDHMAFQMVTVARERDRANFCGFERASASPSCRSG